MIEYEELKNKIIELIKKYKTYHTHTLSNQQQDIENNSSDAILREHESHLRIYAEILRGLKQL